MPSMPCLHSAVIAPGTPAGHPQPTISTTEGLLVRPWALEDAPAVSAVSTSTPTG